MQGSEAVLLCAELCFFFGYCSLLNLPRVSCMIFRGELQSVVRSLNKLPHREMEIQGLGCGATVCKLSLQYVCTSPVLESNHFVAQGWALRAERALDCAAS